MAAVRKIAIVPILILSFVSGFINCTVVTVKNGQIKGGYEGSVTKFLGIPYAEPPLGHLRFKKPLPKQSWAPNVLDCTQYGNRCSQTKSDPLPMSEDCLSLNVFVPGAVNVTNPNRAVMIWVHGGGYRYGKSSSYKPSVLALHGDVIIVTMNYRLNLFGFLTTGDDLAKGNYGLWDQHMSFKWVKDNIATFGGDVNRITIFGASAGGFSVGLHTISPVNSGLFQRAITESGMGLSTRATKSIRNALNVTYWLGREAKCDSANNISMENHTQLLECLRSRSEDELIDAYKEINRRLYGSLTPHWSPVFDGDFLPKPPAKLLEDTTSDSYKFFANLDILSGANSADGAIYFCSRVRQRAFGFKYLDGISKEALINSYIRVLVDSVSTNVFSDITNIAKLGPALTDMYSSDQLNITQQGQRAIDLLTDVIFFAPVFRQVHAHAYSSLPATGFSYIYYFDHMPRHSPKYPTDGYPSWFKGANHVDERPYVFGLENYYPSKVPITDDERVLNEAMMTYWTNFGKTGNPNIPVAVNVSWPQYKPGQQSFMELNIPRRVEDNLLRERRDFWMNVLPGLLALRNVTTPPVQAGREGTTPPGPARKLVTTPSVSAACTLGGISWALLSSISWVRLFG